MDSTTTRDSNLPQMQIPPLGRIGSPQTRQTKVEIRRQRRNESTRRWRQRSPDKQREYRRKYYLQKRSAKLAVSRLYYQRNKAQIIKRGVEYRRRHREQWFPKAAAAAKLRQRQIRLEAMEAYGGLICQCCKEPKAMEFLSIDHIENGRGNPAKRPRMDICRWLKKNGYPSGFQILCYDCNHAKASYGVCPHQNILTPIDDFYAVHFV